MTQEYHDEYNQYSPVERAVAEELGIDVAYVKLVLDTFEDQYNRIEDERAANKRSGL
ncbi:hypothetical protein PP459_gp141 [Streptomyces phage Wakanda]|uniref:Uncharacterized protein n=1 Tax=Streptomyces phage Wakanda TaxID=2713267 RepID=A0A6G8R1M1_9CAUD|nr:hypothetical protein PP459_gp141 [Streptomyces phage Wakanda]QIN94092.1 hypothetical protein SEA_WAKANDA_114 [Streptomyces phage Wakanda]